MAIQVKLAESEKNQISKDKAQLEEEKIQLMKQAEKEKAQLVESIEKEKIQHQNRQLETAIDMLRLGTPIATIAKWTSLPEEEVQRLQADINLSFSNTATP